jgi:aminopeptidase N
MGKQPTGHPRILAVVVLAVGLALPAAAAVAQPISPTPGVGRYTPGAPGAGDDYFPLYGNGGYDVEHYDLAIRYDPEDDTIRGRAVIQATATQDLSTFNLDLVGLTVRSVSVDGHRATWSRTDHELVVTPRPKPKAGAPFRTEVVYDGVPVTFALSLPPFLVESGFIHTDDGALVVGQPEVATTWFPVNDHPSDKATFRVSLTAPTGLDVVAMGVLRSSTSSGGWTTSTWSSAAPMASYLYGFSVGDFDVHEWTTPAGLPVLDAVDPDLPADVRGWVDDDLALQDDVIAAFEPVFGPYPFETTGAIVDDYPIFFALENQTRPIYSWLFWAGGPADFVIAHELAHQWYGDSVALERWQDIWLNEGFATYAEWIWVEAQTGGAVTAQQVAQLFFDDLFGDPDDPFWQVVIGDPGPDLLFDNAVYYRGAMTLAALRAEIGDDAFLTVLRRWAAENADGNVTTDDFVALAEEVSGQQLDDLFQTWLFTPQKPASLGAAPIAALSAARTSTAAAAPEVPAGLVDELRRQMGLGRH